ncbi:UNVERIFIED_CONTAM: hypothetical protein GTU68_003909, partial [Idotea baltica]|nr:hypothetical protein [Idotea baltica]
CLSSRISKLTFLSTPAAWLKPVDGVSPFLPRGSTFGVVGESGSGKTVLSRSEIMSRPASNPQPTSGSVTLDQVELTSLDDETLRRTRPVLQMIFQDPISALNPRRTVRDIIGEPLKVRRDELRGRAEPRVREMLETVGMNPENALDRKPFEFSGGQAQRLSIARALIMNPKVIICDEPVSALDVSVQAQILNLLEDMKERYGLTLVFIAHDLAVVKNVSDRVAVMYLGKICEVAKPDSLYAAPAHHYSKLLLSAIPHPDPLIEARVTQIAADLPSPIDPPSGCRFRTRCPAAQDRCTAEEPVIRQVAEDHYVACHFPDLVHLNGSATAGQEV